MTNSTGSPKFNATQAGAAWKKAVEAEHEQSDRIREEAASDDFWRPIAHRFAPPKRGETAPDDTFKRLAEMVTSSTTVLDVGAGGGRLAIPLAEVCARVTAVEPSEGMREQLVATAEAWNVQNIDLVAGTWEEADVAPHDLVICAHVVYTVREIEHFLNKLTAHARQTVALVVFQRPAMAPYLPLWPRVHGEERIPLPALPEIEQLLSQMGIEYRNIPLQDRVSQPFKSRKHALDECLARLFVAPGSEKSAKLSEVLDDCLVEVDGGYALEWAEPRRLWIVAWDV
ncbi:MAG: methyltransferase domain-containing protein [Chloroflexi bacterium]|nr:methyltransferase domain-containing protein [Chloroflexota bacterium]